MYFFDICSLGDLCGKVSFCCFIRQGAGMRLYKVPGLDGVGWQNAPEGWQFGQICHLEMTTNVK
jgi:hypothetical protein